ADGDFEHLTISGQLDVLARAAAGRPVHLIGSSLGGYLAALYAARHPEVARLVLLAPAFGFIRRWPERLGEAGMENWRRARTPGVYHYGARATRPLRYGLVEAAAHYEDYPDARQPTLIFHGAKDDVVPADESRIYAAARSNVELELVDSGHDLLNVLDAMLPK